MNSYYLEVVYDCMEILCEVNTLSDIYAQMDLYEYLTNEKF